MRGKIAKLINKASAYARPAARRALKRKWKATPADKRGHLHAQIVKLGKDIIAVKDRLQVEDYVSPAGAAGQ
jgi:hypothetical protein